MKKIFTSLAAMAILAPATGQVYSAASIFVLPGGSVYFGGGFTNDVGGTFTNAGSAFTDGNVVNNGATAYDGGTLVLMGSATQTLSGSAAFNTTNLTFNNSAGFNLNKRYSVSNLVTFTAGLVTAGTSTEPLELNPGGSAIAVSGASDAAHVIGFVRQLGTGSFTYPVGDVNKYQPVIADLSANASGMTVNYSPADAGSAAYSTTGLGGSTPLRFYNDNEFWTFAPVSSATGIVTILYDGYRNPGIGIDYSSALKVARRTGSQWNNEGGTVSGVQAAGQVTAAGSLGSFGDFALGSTSTTSALPVVLADFSAATSVCITRLQWKTAAEEGVFAYGVEYSADGKNFEELSLVAAKGSNSVYSYSLPARNGRAFYRLRIHMISGVAFSATLLQTSSCAQSGTITSIYPNPLHNSNDLSIDIAGYNADVQVRVLDVTGRQVFLGQLQEGHNKVRLGHLAEGYYQVQVTDSEGRQQTAKLLVQP